MKSTLVQTLVLVVALGGAGLHLLGLDAVPPGFYADEASIGYNAYSIARTARDEHGTLLPVYFRAFGDYKNPVFIYAAVPSVAIFGPTPAAVRLVAALFGLATCAGIGIAVGQIVRDRWWGVAGFAVATFLPWLLLPGRVAFEAISLPCFLVLGWVLWVQGITTGRRVHFILSGLAHGLAYYAYSTGRIVAPMQLVVLVLAFPTVWRAGPRRLGALAGSALFVAALVPAAVWTASHPGSLVARLSQVSVFDGDGGYAGGLVRFVLNVVRYVSPAFLFTDGDPNLRHHTGTGGMLFLFLLPGLVRGVGAAWPRGADRRLRSLLWLALLFPLVPSLTHTSFHGLRSIHGAAPILILAMAGLRALVTGRGASEKPPRAAPLPPSRVVGPAGAPPGGPPPERIPVALERLFTPPAGPPPTAAGSGSVATRAAPGEAPPPTAGRPPMRWLALLVLASAVLEIPHYTYDLLRRYPERAGAHFQTGVGEIVRATLARRTGPLAFERAIFEDETGRPNQPEIHFLFRGALDPARYQAEGLGAFDIRPDADRHWRRLARRGTAEPEPPAGETLHGTTSPEEGPWWSLRRGPPPPGSWAERAVFPHRAGDVQLYEAVPP